MQGENQEYLSITDIIKPGIISDTDDYPIKEALRITKNGFPPHCLNSKVGAIVVLLKNWPFTFGLCNGTRFWYSNAIIISLNVPLLLSFAITINKSQSQVQTFNRKGFLLCKPVFTHGKLYFPELRVRNSDPLCTLETNQQGLYK